MLEALRLFHFTSLSFPSLTTINSQPTSTNHDRNLANTASMADIEKSPLLPHDATTETGDCSESHLQELGQQVEESRNAWIEATKAHAAAFRRTPAGRTVHRVQTIVLTLCGAFFVFVVGAMLTGVIYAIMTDDDTSYLPPRRIPLEAHIMSKCPDARDCLRDMVLPTMMEVSREVDFKLSYIGQ